MPLLRQRKIGKGINERTEFLNLQDVAKALFTEPHIILRYFGYAFGTKIKIETDPKSGEIITIEINGEFHIEDTLKQLDYFI